jgi:non-heme chloroperoxidase
MMNRRELLKCVAAVTAGKELLGSKNAMAIPADRAGGKRTNGNFIEVSDGTRLFFRDWGKGQPMVFVAPWGLHSAWWEYQMADLAGRGQRCVGLDRRGHGRSDEPNEGYDFDTLADDLATLLEQLDLRGVTLVGQSMGCGEVVRYVSRHGSSRVARIVLVSTITPLVAKTDDNPDGTDTAKLEYSRTLLSKDHAHPIGSYAPTFFGVPKNNVSQEIMDWWTRMMVDDCSLKVLLDLQRMFTVTDFRAELRKISLPTLLIHGDIDASTPIEKTARKTVPLIPGCRLKVYEGAAHGLTVTHAEQLNADLLAFAKS